MRILIVGGTGRIGQLVIQEALKRGHQITALVRDESKLEAREGLTIVKGDPRTLPDVQKALTTPSFPDVIITTLAARRETDSPFSQPSKDTPPRLLADSHATIITALKEHQTQNPDSSAKCKLVILSMAGCADSRAGMPLVIRALFAWSPMRHQLVDHALVDAETRAAAKENPNLLGGYVICRPVMFAEGPAAEVKVWPDNAQGVKLTAKITKLSVAAFMLDAAEKGDWDGRAPVLTN